MRNFDYNYINLTFLQQLKGHHVNVNQKTTCIRHCKTTTKLKLLKSVVTSEVNILYFILLIKIQIIKFKHLQNVTGEVQASGAGRIAN